MLKMYMAYKRKSSYRKKTFRKRPYKKRKFSKPMQKAEKNIVMKTSETKHQILARSKVEMFHNVVSVHTWMES